MFQAALSGFTAPKSGVLGVPAARGRQRGDLSQPTVQLQAILYRS
jgi:hypothetical protein